MQALTAIVLLLPAPFNEPAVKLCQLSRSSNGRTAIWTLTGFMIFMLLAPLWDLYRLSQHSEGSAAGGASLERRYDCSFSHMTRQLPEDLTLTSNVSCWFAGKQRQLRTSML